MATVALNLTAASGRSTAWSASPASSVITIAWGLRGVLSGVPVASRITSAVLSAPASQVGGYAQYPNELIRVHGYDVDAAGAVTAWPAIASITRTNASVLGTPTSSIDVTTVVQAIVNRGGWTGPIGLLLYRPDYSDWQAKTPTGVTLTITYEGPPTLTATAAQTGPHTLTIAPTLDAGDALDHYTVDWGDSATDNLLTHTYATSGSKSWTVTATLSRGRTLTTSGTTSVDNYPQATLTLAVVVGRTVQATTSLTLASGTTATIEYVWSDGSRRTSSDTHTYDLPGTYTVTAHVTDSRGSKTTATAQITVSFATVAVLDATPYGLTVTLDGTQARAATGSSITSWQWDHGDGTTSGGATTTHTYATPGTYRVVLTVTDSNQLTARAAALVTVSRWVDAIPGDPATETALATQTRTVSVLVELLSPDRAAQITWPEGESPVAVGDVTCDGTTLARWSSSIDIIHPDWMPRTPYDPLHHLARTWVRLWWLISLDEAGSWLRAPIGTYRVGPCRVADDGIAAATASLEDPLTAVRRALWCDGGLSLSGMDASEAVAAILADRAPWLPVEWAPSGSVLPVGYQVGTPEGDPLADVEAIIAAHNLDVHTDALGVVQVQPRRSAGVTRARWEHGPDCTVTEWTAETDPSLLCNEATVWSTADGVTPVTATVRDTLQSSPLWIGHGVRYGRAEGLAEVTTVAQCRVRAEQMLADGLASVRGLTVTTRADPLLEPGDLGSALHPVIGSALYEVRKWTLTASAPHEDSMTVTAVERR